MCGGTDRPHLLARLVGGLSPRVRGNPCSMVLVPLIHGSIPACAGEPKPERMRDAAVWVYPRVCGGTIAHLWPLLRTKGLSPRVRGNHRASLASPADERSIPACAGEPWQACVPVEFHGVYPRVCGGTTRSRRPSPPNEGLSPRVRGNQSDLAGRNSQSRSIPACAGEPNGPAEAMGKVGVYPRVCGGTCGRPFRGAPSRGLSPRVRGNPTRVLQCARITGSIPACAGEPKTGLILQRKKGVYPRVCGGTTSMAVSTLSKQGLSPRVRGNLRLSVFFCSGLGSIPACAGEPPSDGRLSRTSSVYPRVCGGTASNHMQSFVLRGLSPRVRGNRYIAW